ncbi:uncharacterized, partial [Tachysurus ichikawai]
GRTAEVRKSKLTLLLFATVPHEVLNTETGDERGGVMRSHR